MLYLGYEICTEIRLGFADFSYVHVGRPSVRTVMAVSGYRNCGGRSFHGVSRAVQVVNLVYIRLPWPEM